MVPAFDTNRLERMQAMSIRGIAVLVVEDEAIIAQDLSAAVNDAGGLVVGPFSRVSDALSALERGDVDAAVLDISLRDGDVQPVADALSAQEVPFVLFTGGSVRPSLLGDLKAPVVEKPATADRVIRRLSIQVAQR